MPKQSKSKAQRHQIWILLDRSGSMGSFGDAVVEGTNEFIEGQRSLAAPCRITLATFDSQDPLDLIVEGIRIQKMRPLSHSQYQPRSATPLYDAIGGIIELADRRIADRKRRGKPDEQHTVLIYSDGLENASQTYDRSQIFKLITERQQQEWVFVFLGANQDSYETGRGLGIDRRSIQNFAGSERGYRLASASASRAMLTRREMSAKESRDVGPDFFGGTREAEADMEQQPRPQSTPRRRRSRRSDSSRPSKSP